MESRILNKIALHTPSTLNPGTRLLASSMMKALINSKKIPKVITVTGSVNRISIGLMNKFKTASTTATITAVT